MSNTPAPTRIQNLESRRVASMTKPGPKPRKDRTRHPMAFRPHVRVGEVIEARAAALDVSRSDYIEYVVTHALGMAEYAPDLTTDTDDGQEALLPDPIHP